jgi:hypothetical protein
MESPDGAILNEIIAPAGHPDLAVIHTYVTMQAGSHFFF